MSEATPKALLFDVQGTVTDFFTTILTELEGLCAARGIDIDGPRFVNDWRTAYSERVARTDPAREWQPVHEIYRTALDELLVTYAATAFTDAEREQLTSAWQRLIPWPDTVPGLSALRERYTIAALSNADVAAVVRISKRANLLWDAIFTAEMSGAFKPNPRTYLMAARYLGLEPAEIMMVASHKYDIRGAAELGFRTAFIARPLEYGPGGQPDVSYESAFDINAASLLELAAKLDPGPPRPAKSLTVNRFDHIVINCRDVEATAAWYAAILGMTITTFGPTGRTALTFGDQKINLRPLGALELDPAWTTAATEAAGSEDLCFVTASSPAAVAAHLRASGVEIINGPVSKEGALGKMVSHYCYDPDGNLIEIAVYE